MRFNQMNESSRLAFWKTLPTHGIESVRKAYLHESGIDPSILSLPGMSSDKTRHLFNNLLAMPDARYLEVGMWKGSTFCSAISNNPHIKCAVGIDNWSQEYGEDDNRKRDCLANVDSFAPPGLNYRIIDQDCFNIDTSKLGGPFNIFFYDGPHDLGSQILALTHFYDCLDEAFLFLVDDYNYYNGINVINGTQRAIRELDLIRCFEIQLPSVKNADLINWWNGLYVAALIKK